MKSTPNHSHSCTNRSSDIQQSYADKRARYSRDNDDNQTATETGVSSYTTKDILSGRGGLANKHEGNRVYRRLVERNKSRYRRLAEKNGKELMVQSILIAIRNTGGRFLKLDAASKTWHELDYKEAFSKTSQALREPDRKRKSCDREGASPSVDDGDGSSNTDDDSTLTGEEIKQLKTSLTDEASGPLESRVPTVNGGTDNAIMVNPSQPDTSPHMTNTSPRRLETASSILGSLKVDRNSPPPPHQEPFLHDAHPRKGSVYVSSNLRETATVPLCLPNLTQASGTRPAYARAASFNEQISSKISFPPPLSPRRWSAEDSRQPTLCRMSSSALAEILLQQDPMVIADHCNFAITNQSHGESGHQQTGGCHRKASSLLEDDACLMSPGNVAMDVEGIHGGEDFETNPREANDITDSARMVEFSGPRSTEPQSTLRSTDFKAAYGTPSAPPREWRSPPSPQQHCFSAGKGDANVSSDLETEATRPRPGHAQAPPCFELPERAPAYFEPTTTGSRAVPIPTPGPLKRSLRMGSSNSLFSKELDEILLNPEPVHEAGLFTTAQAPRGEYGGETMEGGESIRDSEKQLNSELPHAPSCPFDETINNTPSGPIRAPTAATPRHASPRHAGAAHSAPATCEEGPAPCQESAANTTPAPGQEGGVAYSAPAPCQEE